MERHLQRGIESYWFAALFVLLLTGANVVAQDAGHVVNNQTSSTPPAAIPVVDAEMGPCSVEFTVTDPSFKPVQDAKVRVRINYGFMGVRRLDLEAATNADGKARFVGLPNNLKRALYFYAEQGKLRGTAVNDAALRCKASHVLTMRENADAQDENAMDDTSDNPESKREDKPQDKTENRPQR
jgi:hypothetical protein